MQLNRDFRQYSTASWSDWETNLKIGTHTGPWHVEIISAFIRASSVWLNPAAAVLAFRSINKPNSWEILGGVFWHKL